MSSKKDTNRKDALQNLKDYLDSDEGKKSMDEYFGELKIKNEILKGRCLKVEKYLEGKNFEDIIKRLQKEHDETYCDKCYKKGYEPYPNHKLSLLWSYIVENFDPVENELIPQDFLHSTYFFKGYWFTVYCGQGCFNRIYDSKLNNILQT